MENGRKPLLKSILNKSNALSRALLKLGVQKNDKIAVISSTNRTEWNIVDIGVLTNWCSKYSNLPNYMC